MVARHRFEDSWERIQSMLGRAAPLLGDDAHAALTDFRAYLDANELELALDELEAASAARPMTPEFWAYMRDAAAEMKLVEHRHRYERLLGGHSPPEA